MIVRKIHGLALLLLALVLFAAPCLAAAGDQPVLPQKFGGWALSSAAEVPNASLSGALGDNFAVLVESGLISAQRGTYTLAPPAGGSTPGTMQATLYRFRDSNGSYGAYTFLRTADMSSSDLTEKSAVGRDRILAVAGSLLLNLSEPGAASLADLKSLVTLLQKQIPATSYPTLWQYLPGQGLERTSDHYVLGPAGLEKVFPFRSGDWLGLSLGAEAESARYYMGRGSLSLLLTVYPTPQLARVKLQELATKYGVQTLDSGEPSASTGGSSGASTDASAVPADSASSPALYGERRGLMVALVSGARDAREARTLIDRITYQTSVTWNEPSWEAKEPPFLVMIVNILIGTLLLLLYAFIAGLVFAGVRLLVKRFAPGRFFDRDEEVELIQLGLFSKPIEAKDFLTLKPPE